MYLHQPTVMLGTNLLCACCCSVLDAVVLLSASCVQVSTFFPRQAACPSHISRVSQGRMPSSLASYSCQSVITALQIGTTNQNMQTMKPVPFLQETFIRGPHPFLSVSPSFSPFLLLSHKATFNLFCYKPSAMDPVGKSLCTCLSIHYATVALSSFC